VLYHRPMTVKKVRYAIERRLSEAAESLRHK